MKYPNMLIGGLIAVFSILCAGGAAAQPQYTEVIVNFADDATQAEVQAIAQEYGITLTYNSIFSDEEELFRFPVQERTREALLILMDALTAEDEIEYAEPNFLYQAFFVPNDPLYKQQWHLKMIGVENAWEVTAGKGAVVAVIDTGVAFEDYKDKKGTYHRVPDLARTKFVKGYDFIDDDEHANDDNAHGTHVAGTIAQSTNNKVGVAGVAYEAAIMPLKVLNRMGYGNIADIAEAITYAADHGAHVINMSLGGPGESQLMREAIEYAYKKGLTIVCAAGNESRNRASYPAAYPHAVGVSSVGPDGELAPYSNYGTGIDLAAPGGNTRDKREHGVLQNTIQRMDPSKDGYEFFQGTSMASPHVAGVAALIVATGVKKPDKVEEILLNTATDKADKTKYGAGIVNAAAAVNAAKTGDFSGQQAQAAGPAVQKSPIRLKESLLYFLAGIGFALWYFKLVKGSDGYGKILSFLFSLAMFLSSSGLFFLEFLPIPFVPRAVIHAVSSPLPNLDRVLFGYPVTLIHPLLHSMLWPGLLLLALLQTKRGKQIALGLAVGLAAHLVVDAFFSLANVTYIPGGFVLDKLWLLVNAAGCFGIAVLAGRKS
jgi:serine protease